MFSKKLVSLIGASIISISLVGCANSSMSKEEYYNHLNNGTLEETIKDDWNNLYKGGFTMEEQDKIWCPMCQEDTVDMDTHECEQCGYIPEDWTGYLMELGLY